ncbi:MAG TPA: Hpt domain-containing protein [Thermoanaerobaculia bacterium]|nr:Hpt domain-containing protein [Thermoanaerobaculia bacterium]
MTTADVSSDEMRELRLDYLRDVREKVELIRDHGKQLVSGKQFKIAFPALLFLSHQLKGSGGSLGYPRISELASAMNGKLNAFLEEDRHPRLSPQELSVSIIAIGEQLDTEISQAENALTPEK